MYDCLIIGTGPAGFSCALNLKIHTRQFLWFGNSRMSDKVLKAPGVDNYPGLPGVTGHELFEALDAHRRQMGIAVTEKQVTNIMPANHGYMVLADNEVYEARTLALCTGASNARPLRGEEEFLGRGVSYCATCDGNFYRGKRIAVYADSPRFEHEVEFLAGIADSVDFYPSYPKPGAIRDNVHVSADLPVEITGSLKASALTLKSGQTREVDGVFLLRNAIAPAVMLKGLAVENGSISVNRRQETNLPGCYAAGDCTGRPYQYAKAVGEGNVAAHAIIEYLAELDKKER